MEIVKRHFTKDDETLEDVFENVTWIKRDLEIKSSEGEIIFAQKDCWFPDFYSEQAAKIIASKYFYGSEKLGNRESGLDQLILRIVNKIADEGVNHNYLKDNNEYEIFRAELGYLILHQYFWFNSPVQFNVGTDRKCGISACYITPVEDNKESIFDHAKTEGLIFATGAGNGSNLSNLRGSNETIGQSNGTSSGPLMFDMIYDAVAKATLSGGASRRAARLVRLDVDHPDIFEFIDCKYKEEHKARILSDNGIDGSPGGEAYMTVAYQNANYSVGISDAFMDCVIEDGDWHLINRKDGTIAKTVKAREIWNRIAERCWDNGDPGLQFDDIINEWNTCLSDDRIYSSNPCSEYFHLNNTSCDLASLNLVKFLIGNKTFDTDSYLHTVTMMVLGTNILLEFAEYPTDIIKETTLKYRSIGLSLGNLGAFLMRLGIPYDSDYGRFLAAALADGLTSQAYWTSNYISTFISNAFERFPNVKDSMKKVIEKHINAHNNMSDICNELEILDGLLLESGINWNNIKKNFDNGFRNSYVSNNVPTGTCGLAMDFDTTGIEPEFALVKTKKLVGGGNIQYVNQSVQIALKTLGYSDENISSIIEGIKDGVLKIKDEHKEVFACAVDSLGIPAIKPEAHIDMVAAMQPFISGASSKTVNAPKYITVEDIKNLYLHAYNKGLKCISVYRDGCKVSQPLNAAEKKIEKTSKEVTPIRKRLNNTRDGLIHKFNIGGHEGYFMVGLYDNGMPGELFISMNKEGSTISGLMDSFATLFSMALQYGVPLDKMIRKFEHTKFEPSGFTGNPDVPQAHSILDYIMRYLKVKYLKSSVVEDIVPPTNIAFGADKPLPENNLAENENNSGLLCPNCGNSMVRNGTCLMCPNCALTTGCGS